MQGQRILLVSAGMGAGHDQCARELARRFAERGAEVRVVDLLALLPLRLGPALRGFYGGMLAHAPWLYSVIYRVFMADDGGAGARPAAARPPRSRPLARLGARALAPVVRDFAPTAVVSTFHLAGQAVGELRRRGVTDAPSIVVITEMVAHAMWLGGGADLYCCISEPIARRVRTATGADAIGPGPLVDPRFRRDPDARRTALAAGDDATVLVSTGSWGMGDILETVAALAAAPGVRPVALCGRNARLRRRVAAVPGATALGWRDDMPALLAGAAVVVDNAGGSMCMEALAAGVPVVEYRPIAGHGVPVARALVGHGLVTGVADAAALVRAVDVLRRPGPRRSVQVEHGSALFHADPAAEIARWLEQHRG
ncbi:MGDG synthase family glycosyltransferase [Tomitella gaofuii]|uniref:MGDG synthase family glycosyltransferase n=1 Tax=Tomitella gaofuii TaxID=2760083 RepID=UPI0020BFF732|nr:hypothetical protein [Tomitella gaofuii]